MWRCKRCETDNSESDLQCNGCDWHAPQLSDFNYELNEEFDVPTFDLKWSFTHTDKVKCNKIEKDIDIHGSAAISLRKKSKITFVAENEFAVCEFSKMISIPPPQISFFKSDKEYISLESLITFFWKAKFADNIILSGCGDVTDRTTQAIELKESSSITLTAINSAGSDSKTISLNLPEPTIDFFESNAQIIISGERVLLNWKTRNAALTYLKVNSKETLVSGGKTDLIVSENSIIELSAVNETGRVTSKIKVDVLPRPVIHKFTISNKMVLFEKSFHVECELENFKSAFIKYGDTTIGVSDISKIEFTAVDADRIELVVNSLNDLLEIRNEIFIKVIHPVNIISFQASKNYTIQTKPIILSWEVTNANDVIISPINKSVSSKGELSVRPSNKTVYKLTASNELTSNSVELEIDVFSIPSITHLKLAQPPKFSLPQYGGTQKFDEPEKNNWLHQMMEFVKTKIFNLKNTKNINNQRGFIKIRSNKNDFIGLDKANLRDVVDFFKSMPKKQ